MTVLLAKPLNEALEISFELRCRIINDLVARHPKIIPGHVMTIVRQCCDELERHLSPEEPGWDDDPI